MNLRQRGTHSTATKNTNPVYVRPDQYKKRPAILENLRKSLTDNTKLKPHQRMITRMALINAKRERKLYVTSAQAYDVLLEAISDHVNLVTWQVQKSFKGLSDCCGLSTESEKGNVSISRTSRMMGLLYDMGVVYWDSKDQVWDKEAEVWVAKIFYVTELFFEICGRKVETYVKERERRLKLLRQGLFDKGATTEEVGRLTVAAIKRAERINYVRQCFEARSHRQGQSKLKRAAAKAAADDGERGLDLLAQRRVLNALPVEEMEMMTAAEFEKLKNTERAYLRKLANSPNSRIN